MVVVNRLLSELGERDASGDVMLGGCKVEIGNARVTVLWKGGMPNRVAEEFALRMQKETGCLIADIGGYRVVQPEELVGLNERAMTVNAESCEM